MSEKRGTLFIFSGPSGVGKGTLKEKLVSEFGDHIFFSVSATTRAPRPGEEDGVHYFYITREEFEERIAQNDFLEYAQYAGCYYGTPRSVVENKLENGMDVILEIEVQGAEQVMRRKSDCTSVFILPPDQKTLEARLRGRGTEDEERVMKRLAAAEKEISHAHMYDYQIVNDDLDEAYNRLREVYLEHAGFMK